MDRREMLTATIATAAAVAVGAAILPTGAFALPAVSDTTILFHLGDGTTFPVPVAEGTIATDALSALCDADLDYGLNTVIGVSVNRDTYKKMRRGNMIDFMPDAEGHVCVPVFFGRRLYVPGTKLAYAG